MLEKKRKQRQRRIRARLTGTAQCPRVSVFRGARVISVQLIDDVEGHTLLAVKGVSGKGGKIKQASEVGVEMGKKVMALGIKKVVFDRGGYAYHGRVKAVAEGLREAGVTI